MYEQSNSNYMLEITNVMRVFVQFTRYCYCSKTMRFDSPTEKQKANIIEMMSGGEPCVNA